MPARLCTSTRPVIELLRPRKPSTWLIGSSTTWNGMKTPNKMKPNIKSEPLNFHMLST